MKTLKPTKQARGRTKNRIREHGPEFEIKKVDTPICFNGEEAILVESPDGWGGWLSAAEVEVQG